MAETRYLVKEHATTRSPATTVPLKAEQPRYLFEILVTSLALGYVFDVLFYGHALGISVPIFTGLFIAGLVAAMRVRRLPVAWRNLWLLLPLAFFAVMVPFRANPHLTWLNVTAVLFLGALLVYFVAAGKSWDLGMLGYPAAVARVSKEALFSPFPALASARTGIPNRQRIRRFIAVLRGLVLALPVLIVFGALLASADRVFAQLLSDLFRLKTIDNFGETMWRIVIMLTVAWIIAGVLLFATARGSVAPSSGKRPIRFGPLVGAAEGATVLALVNALFAVFAWVQFANIFLGRPSTIDYEAYREYVRRGFGELLLVCVLTLLLILTVRRIADFNSPRAILAYRGLTTLLVALTGVMLLSATKRMDVWQEVMFYISTPLRIYVTVFTMWLAGLFAWLLVVVWTGQLRFGIGALLAAMGFLATVNLQNPDASVASYNLAREDDLSTRYLHLLSEDALPVMAEQLVNLSDPVVKEQLRQHLLGRLHGFESARTSQEWPSFHFSKAQGYDMLKKLLAQGMLDDTPNGQVWSERY